MTRKQFVSMTSLLRITGLMVIGVLYYASSAAMASLPEVLQPFFSYTSEDTAPLKTLNSDQVITERDVNQWVQVVFDLARKNDEDIDLARVYAYLFTAQRDAAALSGQVKGKLVGNIAAVSRKTLCLLMPDNCASLPSADKADPYSLKVADIVTRKVKERLKQEKQALVSVPVIQSPGQSMQHKFYFGKNFGQQKTWLIHKGDQFRLSPPRAYNPSEIHRQKEDLQNILSSVTPKQLEAAHKWADGAGTILTSGRWIDLANDYMAKNHVPLEKALLVRSVLAMGIADATIAYFDSKYAYGKQRPAMLFPGLKTNLKTPNAPSYPSGHATLSRAASVIMDFYFPENQVVWDETAQEISHSRLWAGVHFPVDDYDGQELGRRIGDWIVEKNK